MFYQNDMACDLKSAGPLTTISSIICLCFIFNSINVNHRKQCIPLLAHKHFYCCIVFAVTVALKCRIQIMMITYHNIQCAYIHNHIMIIMMSYDICICYQISILCENMVERFRINSYGTTTNILSQRQFSCKNVFCEGNGFIWVHLHCKLLLHQHDICPFLYSIITFTF